MGATPVRALTPNRPVTAGRVLLWCGWAVVVVLVAIAAARVVAWDSLRILALLNALTVVVYLPAWPVAALAAVRRHWWLAAVATTVVIAQIAFLAPELTADQSLPPAADHRQALKLFDANVYQNNPSMAGYAAQIRADHPDLVTLEEASPEDEGKLLRAGVLARLPFRVVVADYGSRTFLIASRYRLGTAQVEEVDHLPFLVLTSLALPGGPLPLWVVHTTAPVGPSWHNWSVELSRIAALVRTRRPTPLLMVGDFNATWGNRGFHQVLDTGLTDGAAARGRAWDMTWSQTLYPLPPLARIDHVLTDSSAVVTRIRTAPGPGSDHREVVASVAVLAGPARRER